MVALTRATSTKSMLQKRPRNVEKTRRRHKTNTTKRNESLAFELKVKVTLCAFSMIASVACRTILTYLSVVALLLNGRRMTVYVRNGEMEVAKFWIHRISHHSAFCDFCHRFVLIPWLAWPNEVSTTTGTSNGRSISSLTQTPFKASKYSNSFQVCSKFLTKRSK